LERAPRFKRGDIDFNDYPIENASVNAFKFLHDELMHQRHQVYNYYVRQGYLGRSLIYLVDQLIQGMNSVFLQINMLNEKDRLKKIEESYLEPSILIRDPRVIIKT